MIEQPFFHPKSAAKGFVAGALLFSGVFGALDLFISSIVFVVGLLVLIEAVMPSDGNFYGWTVVIFAIVGGFIGYLFFITGILFPYTLVMLFFAIIGYIIIIDKRKSMFIRK
ncbi:MAG: hypothetical protein ABIJ92_04590 [Candidatus Aenigmatarchaeota archaeon]